MSSISTTIKFLRKSNNWVQEYVANEIGTSKHVISNWERGVANPDLDQLLKLANLFDVSTDYLLSDNESFLIDAAEKYGYRGKKKAESFINETALLFAGGELSEKDQDKVFKAITEIYWRSKEKNKKYTPKKYLDTKE